MCARTQTGIISAPGDVLLGNPDGQGRMVILCEHASNTIPEEFAGLGLSAAARQSHIAWDPGALPVASALSTVFDAPLIAPAVSRLVYDCNRAPKAQSAVPEYSEIYEIPGNIGLSAADRLGRVDRFYVPYHRALVAALDRAMQATPAPALVTIHSFTPVYRGQRRAIELGILHDADTRLADVLLDISAADGTLTVGRNQPYGPEDGVTYSLAEHALPRGLLNVMIEIRNDLIADRAGQQAMARRLAGYLRAALARLRADADQRQG